MTVKEQIHAIVDRLDDEQAEEALAYLDDLAGEHGEARPSLVEGTARLHGARSCRAMTS